MIPSLPTLSLTSPMPGAELAAVPANGMAHGADFSALLDLCGAVPMGPGTCNTPLAVPQVAFPPPAMTLPEAASALPADGKILPVDLVPDPLPGTPQDQGEAAALPSVPKLLSPAPAPAPEAAAEGAVDQAIVVEVAALDQHPMLADMPSPALTAAGPISPAAIPVADLVPDRPADGSSTQNQNPASPIPRAAPTLAAVALPRGLATPNETATGDAAAAHRAMPVEPTAAARLVVPQTGAEIPRPSGQSEARLRVALPSARGARAVSELVAAPAAITPGPEVLQSAALPTSVLAPSAATPAPGAPPPLPEAGPRPHDFTALVDRLVAARETLQPQSATLAVQHADFGQISLRLRHDGDALSVALTSADPDFARAVAAAPAPLVPVKTIDQGGQAGPRQDSQGNANSSSNGTFSQSRGSASERRDDPPQQRGSAEPRQFAQQRAKGGQRGGIFA